MRPIFEQWPAEGPITGGFRQVEGYGYEHGGVDIGIPRGTRVVAPGEGAVHSVIAVERGYDFGNWVVLDHGQDDDGLTLFSVYAHLEAFAPQLSVGQVVRPGDLLGWSGGSGKGAQLYYPEHLHWALGGDPLFPRLFGPGELKNPQEYFIDMATVQEELQQLKEIVVGGLIIDVTDGNLAEVRPYFPDAQPGQRLQFKDTQQAFAYAYRMFRLEQGQVLDRDHVAPHRHDPNTGAVVVK